MGDGVCGVGEGPRLCTGREVSQPRSTKPVTTLWSRLLPSRAASHSLLPLDSEVRLRWAGATARTGLGAPVTWPLPSVLALPGGIPYHSHLRPRTGFSPFMHKAPLCWWVWDLWVDSIRCVEKSHVTMLCVCSAIFPFAGASSLHLSLGWRPPALPAFFHSVAGLKQLLHSCWLPRKFVLTVHLWDRCCRNGEQLLGPALVSRPCWACFPSCWWCWAPQCLFTYEVHPCPRTVLLAQPALAQLSSALLFLLGALSLQLAPSRPVSSSADPLGMSPAMCVLPMEGPILVQGQGIQQSASAGWRDRPGGCLSRPGHWAMLTVLRAVWPRGYALPTAVSLDLSSIYLSCFFLPMKNKHPGQPGSKPGGKCWFVTVVAKPSRPLPTPLGP